MRSPPTLHLSLRSPRFRLPRRSLIGFSPEKSTAAAEYRRLDDGDEVREGGGEGDPAQVGCGLRPHLQEDQELPPTQARGPRQVQNERSNVVRIRSLVDRSFAWDEVLFVL